MSRGPCCHRCGQPVTAGMVGIWHRLQALLTQYVDHDLPPSACARCTAALLNPRTPPFLDRLCATAPFSLLKAAQRDSPESDLSRMVRQLDAAGYRLSDLLPFVNSSGDWALDNLSPSD